MHSGQPDNLDAAEISGPSAGDLQSTVGPSTPQHGERGKGQRREILCRDGGHVKKWIHDNKGACTGIYLRERQCLPGRIVISTSGSNTATLVEAKEKVVAQTMVSYVIKLERYKIEKYKDIPIIDDFEHGVCNALRSQSAEETRNSVRADNLPMA
ncbi:hypothetical protein DL768_009114 [Monosporascus sp. mg162]|nr:hypothetical protein DL768_009114 [Monosporascus sp. mg162]